MLEPACSGDRTLQREKPVQQIQEPVCCNKDPAQAKKKKKESLISVHGVKLTSEAGELRSPYPDWGLTGEGGVSIFHTA